MGYLGGVIVAYGGLLTLISINASMPSYRQYSLSYRISQLANRQPARPCCIELIRCIWMDPHTAQMAPRSPTDTPEEDGPLGFGPRAGDVPVPSQAQFLSCLARSESYGLDCPIDRIDTAQSVFFLAGNHCFKLRREIPAGCSERYSLAQRFALAREEIRMGRYFAPELYLDLIPVRWIDGQPYLDLPFSNADHSQGGLIGRHCDAPIIDWMVMLRRFDFSKSYDKLVEIFQPNFTECQQLADLVAASFGSRTIADPAQSWRRHLKDRLASFAPIVRDLDRQSKQPTLRACLNRAENRLSRLQDIIRKRAERGLLGTIHGNVSLHNIVQMPEGLYLVNPDVNRVDEAIEDWAGDPLYDLACLICELWSRGLTRQANWVFSHYFNGLMDSEALDGLMAMDLYLCVRALESITRLKSDLANLDRDKTRPRADCKMTAALTGYSKSLRDCLLLDEARLIVVGGSSHASRSHLTRLLAPAIGRMPGAMSLSAQQELLTLFGVDEIKALPLSAFRKSVWRHVYRRLASKARQALLAGYSVILEGGFDSEISRQHLTCLAEELGSSISVFAFYLYDHGASSHHAGPAREAIVDDLEQQSVACTDQPGGGRVTVIAGDRSGSGDALEKDWTRWDNLDASQSVGRMLDKILERINPLWKPVSRDTLH